MAPTRRGPKQARRISEADLWLGLSRFARLELRPHPSSSASPAGWSHGNQVLLVVLNVLVMNVTLFVETISSTMRLARPGVAGGSGVKLRLAGHLSKSITERILSGNYAQEEVRGLAAILTPGDVMMELRAGIGFLSSYCARIVGSENTYAFEANSELKAVIRDTYAPNTVSPHMESVCSGPPGRCAHLSPQREASWPHRSFCEVSRRER